ncbi:MAG: enoyl-CoA hydratase/isomerase family protein [Nitrososphaerota archaeon]|nr:enoyl-CoA hydratase/isomerase family protein [Nitrososphaerota archaeon]
MEIASRTSGGVRWITLNRPAKANAMSLAMWRRLREEVVGASADAGVRVIAVTGAGKYFCAGEDIADLADADTVDASLSVFLDHIRPAFDAIACSPKVVIAAVNGPAVGAGTELTLVCDLAVASKDAYFALPQGRLGIGPSIALGTGLSVLGRKRLAEMVLTGRRVPAQEAAAWGLVNSVCESDLGEEVERLAEEVAAVPEPLLRLTKEVLVGQVRTAVYHASFRDIALFSQSTETRDGIASFLGGDRRKAPKR